MNEAPSTPENVVRTPGALQAVLQHADGAMDSVAVPLPLPEAIVRVDSGAGLTGRWFVRERSSDSVLRYVEQDPPRQLAAPARCVRCDHQRSEYFVPKAAHGSTEGPLICVDCYTKAAASSVD